MSCKDIAEKFANGATKGRAGNVFIEGKNIYSYGYHFIIATRVTDDAYMVTTRKYSSSTSCQVRKVVQALNDAGKTLIAAEL